MALTGWVEGSFEAAGRTRPIWTKGTGPGVVVIHEIPGITPAVQHFAERVVDVGLTVVMPLLVGEAGRAPSGRYVASSAAEVCVSREFTTMAMGSTSPVVAWLRSLATSLHASAGGPGVGAVGMCFSGGFALGMMVDDVMVAPVLSQPSLPFALGRRRAADLNLSAADIEAVRRRAEAGCDVLGLRYTGDRLVGTRFDSLRTLLGERFIAVEFPSRSRADHSVLTEHPQEDGILAVLNFLQSRLLG